MTRDGLETIRALATLRVVAGATGGHCDDCITYLTWRRPVLIAAVNATARERQLRPARLLLMFVAGVHARHEAGLSIGNEAAA